MNTQATKKQPVRRYYLLAAILMLAGLAKFPWSGQAAVEPNALVISIALIGMAVACVIRGRRNNREASHGR